MFRNFGIHQHFYSDSILKNTIWIQYLQKTHLKIKIILVIVSRVKSFLIVVSQILKMWLCQARHYHSSLYTFVHLGLRLCLRFIFQARAAATKSRTSWFSAPFPRMIAKAQFRIKLGISKSDQKNWPRIRRDFCEKDESEKTDDDTYRRDSSQVIGSRQTFVWMRLLGGVTVISLFVDASIRAHWSRAAGYHKFMRDVLIRRLA